MFLLSSFSFWRKKRQGQGEMLVTGLSFQCGNLIMELSGTYFAIPKIKKRTLRAFSPYLRDTLCVSIYKQQRPSPWPLQEEQHAWLQLRKELYTHVPG